VRKALHSQHRHGVAVARAAGLHTSRIDGSPLRYNQADLLLPDLVVCRPQYAPEVLAALR
jgi:3'(2'), 5'-bisphosphate nucleotidase